MITLHSVASSGSCESLCSLVLRNIEQRYSELNTVMCLCVVYVFFIVLVYEKLSYSQVTKFVELVSCTFALANERQ